MAEEAKSESVQQWLAQWHGELERKELRWQLSSSGLIRRAYGDLEVYLVREGKSYQIRGRKINVKRSQRIKMVPDDDPLFEKVAHLCDAIQKFEKTSPPVQKMIVLLDKRITGSGS